MAKLIEKTIIKTKVVQFLKINNKKIPLLPLYFIAALHNDTKVMYDLENHKFDKYYRLQGEYGIFANHDFILKLEIHESDIDLKTYSDKVITNVCRYDPKKVKMFSELLSFSPIIYLSLLFLLDNGKIDLSFIDKYFNFSFKNIEEKILEQLESMPDISYRNYFPSSISTDVPFKVLHYKSIDNYVNNTITLDTKNIQPVETVPILSKLYEKYTNPKSFFKDGVDMYEDPLKEYFNVSITKIKNAFPLFKVKSSTDNVYYSKDYFMNITDNAKYKNLVNSLSVCTEACYYTYSDANVSNFDFVPSIKTIDLNEQPNGLPNVKIHISDSEIYDKTTDFVNDYLKNSSTTPLSYTTICLEAEYDDLQVIYIVDLLRALELWNKSVDDWKNNQNTCNSELKTFLDNRSKISSSNNIIIENSNIKNIEASTDGSKLIIGKIPLTEATSVDRTILVPNNGSVEYIGFTESFVYIPNIKLDLITNSNFRTKIINNLNSILRSFDDNKSEIGEATLYNRSVQHDVLYKCNEFMNNFWISLEVPFDVLSTDASISYLDAILKHIKIDLYEFANSDIPISKDNVLYKTDYYNQNYDAYNYNISHSYNNASTPAMRTMSISPRIAMYASAADTLDSYQVVDDSSNLNEECPAVNESENLDNIIKKGIKSNFISNTILKQVDMMISKPIAKVEMISEKVSEISSNDYNVVSTPPTPPVEIPPASSVEPKEESTHYTVSELPEPVVLPVINPVQRILFSNSKLNMTTDYKISIHETILQDYFYNRKNGFYLFNNVAGFDNTHKKGE